MTDFIEQLLKDPEALSELDRIIREAEDRSPTRFVTVRWLLVDDANGAPDKFFRLFAYDVVDGVVAELPTSYTDIPKQKIRKYSGRVWIFDHRDSVLKLRGDYGIHPIVKFPAQIPLVPLSSDGSIRNQIKHLVGLDALASIGAHDYFTVSENTLGWGANINDFLMSVFVSSDDGVLFQVSVSRWFRAGEPRAVFSEDNVEAARLAEVVSNLPRLAGF